MKNKNYQILAEALNYQSIVRLYKLFKRRGLSTTEAIEKIAFEMGIGKKTVKYTLIGSGVGLSTGGTRGLLAKNHGEERVDYWTKKLKTARDEGEEEFIRSRILHWKKIAKKIRNQNIKKYSLAYSKKGGAVGFFTGFGSDNL